MGAKEVAAVCVADIDYAFEFRHLAVCYWAWNHDLRK